MKKFILSILIAAFFAACSNPQPAENIVVKPATDTAGLAAFNNWKEQQAAFSMEGVDDVVMQEEPVQAQAPATVVVYRDAPVKRSVKKPAARKAAVYTPPASQGERVARSRTSEPANNPSSDTQSETGAGTGQGTGVGDGTGTEDVATTTQPAKKEGWSKAAKGTAIGGASGAVVGAIISKNKTAGAIIGGVVGAAGGYVLGRKQDKKDGRY